MGWTEGILNVTINGGEENEREEPFMENYGTLTLEQVVESCLICTVLCTVYWVTIISTNQTWELVIDVCTSM